MAPTLWQWMTQLSQHLSDGLSVPVLHGNPEVGGDSPLGLCDQGAEAYAAVELGPDGIYLTREPWPTQRSHYERAPVQCEEAPAAHLVARLVLCVPTGDAEGRPVDAASLDASAESFAASGAELLALVGDFTTLDKASRPTCTAGPVRPVPKSGGAAAWECDLTVPLPCP